MALLKGIQFSKIKRNTSLVYSLKQRNFFRTIYNFNTNKSLIKLNYNKFSYILSINYFNQHFLEFNLKNGVLKNYIFASPVGKYLLKSDEFTESENVSLLFPIKSTINLYDPKSIYDYNWDIIGTVTSPKYFKTSKIKLIFGTKINFFYNNLNKKLDLYFTIEIFESALNKRFIRGNLRNFFNKIEFKIKFILFNSDNFKYYFKSCLFFRFYLNNNYYNKICKLIGLQGSKYLNFDGSHIDSIYQTDLSIFYKPREHFSTRIYMNSYECNKIFAINSDSIYIVRLSKGFKDFLINTNKLSRKTILNIGVGNILSDVILNVNEIFQGEIIYDIYY